MDLLTLIFQILLTIPLTIIINIFNKKENRILNGILIPTIYIIIISALIPYVKTNIFLIVIFEIFIRNFYVTSIVMEESKIINTSFIIESLISIALSLFTYNYFISKVETVIPDPESIKAFVWFLVILYIVYLVKLSSKNKKETKEIKKHIHQKEQNIMQYAKYKNMYGNTVKSKKEIINNMIYAIMIYQNYKTPKLYRSINSYFGNIIKKETKYGIMQVNSWSRMSDEESIIYTLKEFETKLKNTSLKEKGQIDKLLSEYSEIEKEEITNILKDIIEFQKK